MKKKITQKKCQREVSKSPAEHTNACTSYSHFPFYQENSLFYSYTLSVESIKNKIFPKHFYEREQASMPQTKNLGWNNGGLCPFHSDLNAGSFFVHCQTGAYKCFSCGAGGGDIIAFVMQRDHLEFKPALEKLAQEWGIFL